MAVYLGRNDRVLLVDGKVAIHEDCCNPFPDSCPCDENNWGDFWPCEGLSEYYRIKDYTDGDLGGCDDCDSYGGTAWNGTFRATNDVCIWSPPSSNRSIDGVSLDADYTAIELDSYWFLRVGCLGPPFDDSPWEGRKCDGPTPAGIYTRNYMCYSGPSSIEIEAYTP